MISKLRIVELQKRLIDDVSFENVLKNNLTKLFWDDLDKRINSKLNNFFVLFIWGRQGEGKSSIAQMIMQKYFPEFSVKQIGFTNSDVIDFMKNSKEGDSYIKDETPFQYGAGSKIDENTIKNFMNQLRARRNNFIYINPTMVYVESAHYMLETLIFNEETRKIRCGLQETKNFRYLGYVDFDISPIWRNNLFVEYEKKKKEFLKQVVNQDYGTLNIKKSAEIVMKEEEFKECVNEKGKLVMGYLKNLIADKFSNIGKERQDMIKMKVKQIFESSQ